MGTKNAVSTSTMTPPSWLTDSYKNLVGSANQTASTPYTPYTGGFTPDQQQAFGHIGSMWGASNDNFNAANSAYNTALTPTYQNVQNYMNPYVSSVVDATMANMQQQNAQQHQNVIGNAIAKGSMGGNRVGVAQAELTRQQKLADNEQIAKLWSDGFQQAMGAAQNQQQVGLQGAAGLGNLGQTQMATNLSQAGAQLGAGTQQQQFDYQQYLNKLGFPYQQQSWLSSIYGGLAPNAGGTTVEEKPAGNIFSQLLGAGLGIASGMSDGGRIHAASGGVIPYANDNMDYGAAQMGVIPYASNDNASFGSYVPFPLAVAGGSPFPTISPDEETMASGGVVRGYDAGGKISPWDGLVNSFGSALSKTPIGRVASRFAPNQWGGMGNWFKGLDNRAPAASMGHQPMARQQMRQGPSQSNPVRTGSRGYTLKGGWFDKVRGLADGGVISPMVGAQMQDIDPFLAGSVPETFFDPASLDFGPAFDPIRAEYLDRFQDRRISPRLPPTQRRFTDPQYPWLTEPAYRGAANGGAIRPGYAAGGPMVDWDQFYGAIDPGMVTTKEPAPTPEQIALSRAQFGDHSNLGQPPLVIDGDRLGLGEELPPIAAYADIDPSQTLPEASVEPFDAPGAIPSRGGFPVAPGAVAGAVPYSSGDQFITTPAPGYSQNIGDAFRSMGEGKGLNMAPDFKQALLAAGMGMMASKSPFFLQGVGEGGLKGVEVWNKRQEIERENAKQRALTGQTAQQLEMTAAQTAANVKLMASQAEAQAITFTGTPMGVRITDARNPTDVKVVPWGQVLPGTGKLANKSDFNPDGTPKNPITPDITNTDVDPRLMAPETVPQVMADAEGATAAALPKFNAAVGSNQLLQEMEHQFDKLPDTGWLSPGSGFTERFQTARNINTALATVGVAPVFPENEVAAAEDLNKLTFRLGSELGNSIGQGAATVVMEALEATPSGVNSRAGAEIIIKGLRAMNQRSIDYYTLLQKYKADHYGSTMGFDAEFNRKAPPELYALSSYVPVSAIVALRANPQRAGDFNAKYGNGKDVAKFVLAAGG